MELRIVRLVATLGFFFTVVMAIVTIQNDESAWGYGVGAALLGFMAAYLWKDDLVAQGNAREREKADGIARSNQGHGQIVFPTPPNQLPAPGQVTPPTGPSSPIQRGN